MKKIRNTIYAGALLLAFSAYAQDDLWGDVSDDFDNQSGSVAESPAPAPAPAPVSQPEAPVEPVAQPEPQPAPEPVAAPAQQAVAEPAPAPAPAPQAIAEPALQPVAQEVAVAAEPAPVAKAPAEPGAKRFWIGLTVAGTYNDFWDSKFGFNNIESGKDYQLKISGSDELMSNYWGLGANVGISSLFLLNPNLGIRTDVVAASRRGDGESDVTVKLYWDDESRQPEKSDIKMKYYVRQMNIDVPVTLRYMHSSMFYAEAGPLFSFNLYSKTKFSVTDIYGTEEFREHDCFNTFEFAAVGGLGVIRPIGKTMLDIGLRFVLGITPLSDADDSPKTWQGQLNIAYWFI